jgi:DNA-binding transcriptional regulator YiaG
MPIVSTSCRLRATDVRSYNAVSLQGGNHNRMTKMANMASLLKDEISRLSRREIRRQMQSVKKASAVHRREIAALKRQVLELQRRSKMLVKRTIETSGPAVAAEPSTPLRFVAKGLRSLRSRLGLSASELATLLNVSPQTVYNWELKKTVPRKEQLAALATVRSLGKREARARLDQAGSRQKPKKSTRKKR